MAMRCSAPAAMVRSDSVRPWRAGEKTILVMLGAQGMTQLLPQTDTAPAALTRHQWLVLAAAFLGWMFDGVEIGLFPLVCRPALQELLKDTGDSDVGRWTGFIVACFLLGAAAGGVLFGWLGDKIGRMRAMSLSILVYSLFTGAGYFAQQAWHLGVFRFIASLGMGGEWAVAVALVVECWPERHRPRLAGAIGAASNFGFLFIGMVAWMYPVMSGSWRWLMLVGATPAVLALFVTAMVPESERWKTAAKTAKLTPLVEDLFSRTAEEDLAGHRFFLDSAHRHLGCGLRLDSELGRANGAGPLDRGRIARIEIDQRARQ